MDVRKITKDYLKKKTQEFDLETIFVLNLKNKSLYDLGCIGNCINLVFLDLSKNNLTSVMSLCQLFFLERLDLSENKLSALSGVEHLESLKSLNVAGNLLGKTECLLPLTNTLSLKTLFIEVNFLSNPLYEYEKNAKDTILNMLPKLELLDGESLIGYGKQFNSMCTHMGTLAHKYSDLMNVDHLNEQSLYFPDSSNIRIGMEGNDVYEKVCKLSTECNELSKKLHEELST